MTKDKSVSQAASFPTQKVLLTQTDTTVGLLSQDASRLTTIKQRPQAKSFLKVYADLKAFKSSGGRIPKRRRSQVRRSKRRTYVVKDEAFRIINDSRHHRLLKQYGWSFSTSANQSGHSFKRSFCEASADIIVEDFRGLYEGTPSSIELLGRVKRRKIR